MYFCKKKNTIDNNQFSKLKTLIFIHVWSDKAFKGTVVNCELSMYEGSLEITLTVPLKCSQAKYKLRVG